MILSSKTWKKLHVFLPSRINRYKFWWVVWRIIVTLITSVLADWFLASKANEAAGMQKFHSSLICCYQGYFCRYWRFTVQSWREETIFFSFYHFHSIWNIQTLICCFATETTTFYFYSITFHSWELV